MIPLQDLKCALEQDPEFQHAIRHWTACVRLGIGDRHHQLRLVDGALEAVEPCDASSACDVFITGAEEEWRELLRAEPRPFYQDLFFASTHHGLEINRNPLDYAAYYPALRRMIEVMRAEVMRAEVMRVEVMRSSVSDEPQEAN